MSLKIWVKLTILFTALSATVIAIAWLKQGHMNAFWTSLGLGHSGNRLNWCDERVGTLHIFSGNSKLLEKDGKWLWASQDREKELDYLRVEKWFAKYCQLPFEEAIEPSTSGKRPIFEAQFIDGNRATLFENEDGVYSIGGHSFKSETLRQALKELLAFGGKIE